MSVSVFLMTSTVALVSITNFRVGMKRLTGHQSVLYLEDEKVQACPERPTFKAEQ